VGWIESLRVRFLDPSLMIHALGLFICRVVFYTGRILRGSYSTGFQPTAVSSLVTDTQSLTYISNGPILPEIPNRGGLEPRANEQDGVCTDDVSETSSRCSIVSTFNAICFYTFQDCRSSNGLEVWYFKIDSGTIKHDTSLAVFSIM
jgi:hypothetical protein